MILARRVTAALFLVAAVACTSPPSAAECAKPGKELVFAVQSYVDAFADVSPSEFARGTVQPPSTDLAAAVAAYRSIVGRSRCEPDELTSSLARELAAVKGKGVIGQTIATTLRTTLAREETFASAAPTPETRVVEPGEDLAAAAAGVVPGSTLKLSAGEFTLSTPLILLDEITIVGAGRDRTTIVSTAPGASIAFVGDQTLRLENLSLTYKGREPASLVVLRAGSYVIRNVRLSGARRGAEGVDGIGLVVGAAEDPDEEPDAPRRTMRIEDVELVDNKTSGITVGGFDAPAISRVTVSGSAGCGICFLGERGGSLRDSAVRRSRIGVTVSGSSKPSIRDNTFQGNEVGIQVRDTARPVIRSNRFDGNSNASLVFLGTSRGTTSGNVCAEETFEIVLLDRSAPALGSDRCDVLNQRKRSG